MSTFKGPDIQKSLPNFQPNTSVLKLFEDALRKNGNAIAMVEGETGRSVSFSELLQQSRRIAAGLRGAGVAARDYVLLCCDKSILSLALVLGTFFTGATAVLIPSTYAENPQSMIKGQKVKAIFFDPKYQDFINKIQPPPSIIACLSNADERMANILNNYSGDDFVTFEVSDVNTHIPLVVFSNGTTGEPKGVKISDVGLQRPGFNFRRVTTILCGIPLYGYSSMALLSANIFQGFTWVMTNCVEVKEILKLAVKYKVKVLYASPSFLVDYYQELSLHSYDLSSLHTLQFGGDVVHGHILKTLSETKFQGKIKLQSIYGTTETGGLTKCENPSGMGHSGSPLPGVELKVVDDEGSVVEVGELGHVMCRCPGLTPGYWDNRPLELDHEGFYRSGDVGFKDTKGHLQLRGRAVDLILYRGIKVSPWDIEDVLMTHPGVANVAVLGRLHSLDGQHPVAYVIRREGSDVTENELVAFVNSQDEVDEAKKLRGVNFIDQIPYLWKIQRKVLMERAMKTL